MIEIKFRVLLAKKETRDRQSYSYREIEDLAGVSKNTIGSWANNKAQRLDLDALNAFCKFLDCTPGELLIYIPEE